MQPDQGIFVNIPWISGPLLIGYFLNWAFYGVLSAQVYLYHIAFPNDPARNKRTIYTVFILETAQTILTVNDALKSYASDFGSVEALTAVHHAWFTTPIVTGVVACAVQMFYAFQIYDYFKLWILSSIILAAAFIQLGGAIFDGILSFNAGTTAVLGTTPEFVGHVLWNVVGTLCDIIIATSMIYGSLPKSNLKQSQTIISRILHFLVGTGLLTALVSITKLVLLFGYPHESRFYMGSFAILSKIYSNSMMVYANGRIEIFGGRNMAIPTEIHLGSTVVFYPSSFQQIVSVGENIGMNALTKSDSKLVSPALS